MIRTNTVAIVSAFTVLGLLMGCAVNDTLDGTPRVVVVVDESASFKANLSSAVKIVSRFIGENALAGDCEVYLIAMDRAPRVLQYYPSGRTLDASGNQILEELETAINPLDGTDVVGALRLASYKLAKDNGQNVSSRSLLVFSDCHVDPAHEAPAQTFAPLSEFNWTSLDQVQCRFYFVSSKVEPELATLTDTNGLDALVLDGMESQRLAVSDVVDER